MLVALFRYTLVEAGGQFHHACSVHDLPLDSKYGCGHQMGVGIRNLDIRLYSRRGVPVLEVGRIDPDLYHTLMLFA